MQLGMVGLGRMGANMVRRLIQKGHKVRVFEALHEIGGVLVYGIPEFRLPKQIVREQIDYMRAMGVEFETDPASSVAKACAPTSSCKVFLTTTQASRRPAFTMATPTSARSFGTTRQPMAAISVGFALRRVRPAPGRPLGR